jgi:predicted O-methyltransferase YrrM
MLRHRLKSLTPELLLNLRRYWSDWVSLAQMTPEHAPAERLASVASGDLAKAFSIVPDAEWRDLHARIAPWFPDIDPSGGSVTLSERRALYTLTCWFAPRRLLEVGTFIGASTTHLAAALERIGREAGLDCRLTTVDIADVNQPDWARRWGATRTPQAILEALGLSHFVEFVTAPSLGFLEGSGDRFDLVFIDGNHRAATVYREIAAVLRRLEDGGIVVLHDVNPGSVPLAFGKVVRGPWLAVERLRCENALEVLPLGQLPWGGTTSLALLMNQRGNRRELRR